MQQGNKTIRVLIIDDDEDDYFITSDYIKNIPVREFTVDWSYKYDDALQRLKANTYDIYFVDYRLGIKTGMELLQEAMDIGCEAPIILLTGKGTQEIDVKAMEIGAYDYLIKSELNTEKLERCIRYSLERAASLKALKANERKYRAMFEKAKDVVFITSIDFALVEINYAVTELLDYEQEELIQTDLTSLFSGARAKTFFSNVLNELGEINDYETDMVSKNGEIKNCIISASMEISNDGGKYIQGIIHDNTARKRAERSALYAEKLAATGRLVRTLAHEVRNPLNNISLSIEQLIQHNQYDGDSKIYLDIVKRNSKRIGDLITELLDSSRLNAQISLIRGSLQSVLDKAVEAALDRLTLKRILLYISYPEKQAYTLMDEEKLKIAFLNIIINAIEAMEEQVGKLSLSIQTTDEKHRVLIKDNGVGISEESMQRLFEPYFTSKRNGMGLGLASTLNIIQSHSAHIDVESEVEKGTTFIISFKKEV